LQDLLRRHLQEKGLSVTALNNFIKNPWDYFYRNVLRVPEVQSLSLLYGTTVHAVLEKITKYHTANQTLPGFNEVNKWLDSELSKLPITVTEFADLKKKGQEMLVIYLPHLAGSLGASHYEELSIDVNLKITFADCPEIRLTGKLDRIDLDKEGQVLRVVDYKTGKAKSRNEIEGKTVANDAGYRRQLAFYALLLKLHDDERYLTNIGTLSFVEADSKGRIHEETYESTSAELEELIKEIEKAVQSIWSGEFLTDRQSLLDSEYADIGQIFMNGL
jgi:DNA helicase-2/ATP-dependent DNA helicase PcrA